MVGAFASILDTDGYTTILLIGVLLPIVFGWTWAFLLWLLAGTFVILAILLIISLEIALCAWLAYQAGWFDSTGIDLTSVYNSSLTQTASEDMKKWYSALAAIMIIFTIWHIIALVLARAAIVRLIAILRETAKVHKNMALILLWPIMSVILQGLLFVGGLFGFYFMVYAYVRSQSTLCSPCTPDPDHRLAHLPYSRRTHITPLLLVATPPSPLLRLLLLIALLPTHPYPASLPFSHPTPRLSKSSQAPKP